MGLGYFEEGMIIVDEKTPPTVSFDPFAAPRRPSTW